MTLGLRVRATFVKCCSPTHPRIRGFKSSAAGAAGGASSVPVCFWAVHYFRGFAPPRLRCLGTTAEELAPTPGGRAVELDELKPLLLLLVLAAAPADTSLSSALLDGRLEMPRWQI